MADVTPNRRTTVEATIVRAAAGTHPRYRQLTDAPGLPHLVRDDLAPLPAGEGTPIVTIAHLSDIHLIDPESPARFEVTERMTHRDQASREQVEDIGSYRPQEAFTRQVLDSMVVAVNGAAAGPLSGRPIDVAITTGDTSDNAHANEIGWALDVLEGGPVTPGSGDPEVYAGAGGPVFDSDQYWVPEGEPADYARVAEGFPAAPGAHLASKRGFEASGLDVPWLSIYGNHDRLVGGVTMPTDASRALSVQALKAIEPRPDAEVHDAHTLKRALDELDFATYGAAMDWRTVAVDAGRRLVERAEWVAAHFRDGARPAAHGFTEANRADGTAYYRHDVAGVTFLALDTVVPADGWDGSLDRVQLSWLIGELDAAGRERRLVVLMSHHTSTTLGFDPAGDRVTSAELIGTVQQHPCVIAWLNGHTHANEIRHHGTFWEVTAASLIDWPQQARIVEVVDHGDTIVIGCTLLDHAAPATWAGGVDTPLELASLSRELSANTWQRHPFDWAGELTDRNVLLPLPHPFA
ncbi:MAG TPA: TIGR03767 family metallophosphoesterase [Candidatus Lumbricidophila sp.]|nr:TIGR03767 family metallophosphoesterase [Candidatus Lumbricidophila sp.]